VARLFFLGSSFLSNRCDSDTNDNCAVTDDEKAKMQVMFARMMQKYPKWKGPITPEESVKRILDVVKNSKVEQSGQFLSYWGNTTQWL
jgi:hypothetical protein